tara:strand:- start:419 stop:1213 length:795 start_codon:yes stop_codon:yes gene_type:complete
MNNIDLKMYPVKQDDDVYQITRDLPSPLQKPPFVSIIVGGKGSGKTSALINELCRSNMYGECKNEENIFDDIIVYSGTLGSDSTSRHLIKKSTMVSNTYDDESLMNIVDYQKSKDKKDRRHICIVADDIASMIRSRDSELYKLTSTHRHYLCSIYYLVQNWKMLPPVARSNASNFHIYRIPSSKEQEKVFEDLGFMGNKKMIKNLYDYATNKPYNFLFIDAIKHEAYKWGNQQPEFLWKKYSDDGGYNEPFVIPSNVEIINDEE